MPVAARAPYALLARVSVGHMRPCPRGHSEKRARRSAVGEAIEHLLEWARPDRVEGTGMSSRGTVCHPGNLACWNRRCLRWDPRNWQFVGDELANEWLDRDRREPWHLPKVLIR